MTIKNFEFKAKVPATEKYEAMISTFNPVYVGLDRQIDTYFNVPNGRLKLREGNIENALINYERADIAGAKKSEIILYEHQPSQALKDILSKQLGVKVIVDKKRKIYRIGNVKFHFDQVERLGTFIEVEAIDTRGKFTMEELQDQCETYLTFFGLPKSSLVEKSYSDLLME